MFSFDNITISMHNINRKKYLFQKFQISLFTISFELTTVKIIEAHSIFEFNTKRTFYINFVKIFIFFSFLMQISGLCDCGNTPRRLFCFCSFRQNVLLKSWLGVCFSKIHHHSRPEAIMNFSKITGVNFKYYCLQLKLC